MTPRISIITPWLDHPEFIADYEQAVRGLDAEVIVVDNGSADANAAALRSMVNRLVGKYIRNEENRWFSAANNQGLAVATGQIILFINNDISAEPGWLEQVRRDVKDGSIFGPTMRRDQVDQWVIDYIEGSCIAATRPVWDRIGAWNERAFHMNHAEDLELSVRATRAGLNLVKTDWPFHHKGNGTGPYVPGAYAGAKHNGRVLREVLTGRWSPDKRTDVAEQSQEPQPPDVYLKTGRLPDGEREYRRALEQQPERAHWWMNYGMVLRMSGRFEAAATAFNRAKAIDSQFGAQVNSELGITWTNAQRHTEAIAAFTEAARMLPHSTEALCNLAEALTRAGRHADAVRAARQAIDQDARSSSAHIRLALALAALRKGSEAIEAATMAAQLNPRDVHAHCALAVANQAAGNVNEMVEAFNRAASINPEDVMVRYFRDTVLRRWQDQSGRSK